jgi:anti-sigma regulatory factor (Ser/Thr protein kinase)
MSGGGARELEPLRDGAPVDGRTIRVATRFPARPESLAQLHTAFDGFFELAAASDATVATGDRVAIVTAAGEVAANIVLHACARWPEASIALVIERLADCVQVSFEDPGEPFVALVKPRVEGEIPQSGMGLPIARLSTHALEYTRGRDMNRWRLVRNTAGK